MPRYFFDHWEENEVTGDEVGLDLPGVEEARQEAVRALVDLASDTLSQASAREIAIEVRDEHAPLFRVSFILTVHPYDGGAPQAAA